LLDDVVWTDKTSCRSVARPRRRLGDPAVIFVLALSVRVTLVLVSSGGLSGNYGYDASVYYTSADALIGGRIPYGDFLLLHPPGLMLCLTPFAMLGRLTTDHTGFITANLALSAIGALNAALVAKIGTHVGLSRGAALLGGAFYATWLGAAGAEFSARLEPLSTFAFLCGLLLLLLRPEPSSRVLLLSGAVIGFAPMVKIWWIVPLLVVLAWQLSSSRGWHRIGRLSTGVAACWLVIAGPFFVMAPSAMWRMVVTDQLGRPHSGAPTLSRLEQLSSLHVFTPHLGRAVALFVVGLMLVVVLLLSAGAWRVPAGRLFVVVAGAQIAVLLTSPTYITYYSGYPAAAIALVLAAGADGPLSARGIRLGRAAAGTVVAVTTAVLLVGVLAGKSTRIVTPFPGPALARAVAGVRCVVADSPMALIELNTLSRGLANGCPNWVDVNGRTYDVDAPSGSMFVPRTKNRRWQADALHYLLSGDAVILIRPATGLNVATIRAITSHPVLARSHGYTVYRSGR
jgi:alpha-1,2-mannosyltransferase